MIELDRMDEFYKEVDVERRERAMPLADFEDSEGRLVRPSDEGSSVYEMEHDLSPVEVPPGCKEPGCENFAATNRGMYAYLCYEHKKAKQERRAQARADVQVTDPRDMDVIRLEDDAGGAVEIPNPLVSGLEELAGRKTDEDDVELEFVGFTTAEAAADDDDLVVLAQAVANAQRHLEERVAALRRYMDSEGWLT